MQTPIEKDNFELMRKDMVRLQLKARGISDPNVLRVMGEIPREDFVPPEFQEHSYDDNPLPIGAGQTISQPYIVALMTEELRINKDCDILEIGTGSGYQAAILAKLGKHVYTIERIGRHSANAEEILNALNFTNISFQIGDGTCGWQPDRKFDRIIVTAAAPEMPKPLANQLNVGGFAIVPIGPEMAQELVLMEKTETGLKSKVVCGCRFVKLLGKFGYAE